MNDNSARESGKELVGAGDAAAEVTGRAGLRLTNDPFLYWLAAKVAGTSLRDRDAGRAAHEILARRQNQPARGRFHPEDKRTEVSWVEQASGLSRRASRASRARLADELARYINCGGAGYYNGARGARPSRKGRWMGAIAAALLLCVAVRSQAVQAGVQVRDRFNRILGLLTTTTAPMPLQADGDLLQFVDGSAMHGELHGMDVGNGLHWQHRDAKYPIDLRPGHIDFIRFVHASSMTLAPTCHIRFTNGDDLFGSLVSLDTDNLEFTTWFGGTMKIARPAVETVTFLSKNYSILYEGPTDASGWVIGNNGPQSWSYRDGSFVAQSPGILGRDFNLSGSCTIEFDLAWTSYFNVVADIYSDMLDHFESENNSYMLDLSHEQVILQRVRGNTPPVNLGNAPLPNLDGRGKMHVTIHCNKQEGTVAVLVDNTLVKRWKDANGFSANGTGILFENRVGTSSVKLSNFRISHWEGRFEPQEISSPSTNADSVCFLNHDKAEGKIAAIKDGKVDLVLEGNTLHVPIDRVTQIDFAQPATNAEPRGPWQVRAMFPGGGSVSFQLRTWDANLVSGQSSVFGALNFKPSAIRELEFNLDRPRNTPSGNPEAEFEELDE